MDHSKPEKKPKREPHPEPVTPTLPPEERYHLCATCGRGGAPWYGLRGDHPTHDRDSINFKVDPKS
jgi:hypothetical protein